MSPGVSLSVSPCSIVLGLLLASASQPTYPLSRAILFLATRSASYHKMASKNLAARFSGEMTRTSEGVFVLKDGMACIGPVFVHTSSRASRASQFRHTTQYYTLLSVTDHAPFKMSRAGLALVLVMAAGGKSFPFQFSLFSVSNCPDGIMLCTDLFTATAAAIAAADLQNTAYPVPC